MSETAKDWADAKADGVDIREEADRIWARSMKIDHKPDWRDHVVSAAELQHRTFPSIKFIVPGLLPEGLTLLCGRPKVGKSWVALEIALAVASGTVCFGGRLPQQGSVLYAALEDNLRRLQARVEKLWSPFDTGWPEQLTLTTAWSRLDKGGVKDIAEWIKSADNPRLVILDTLAGVKPIRGNGGYAEDYASLQELHRLANDLGIAVLVLHHTRKMDADDPFDTISGTLGLVGCADTALVFVGSSQGMRLYVRGRDIAEAEHAVSFDKTGCRWTILGDASEVQKSDTRKAILKVLRATTEPLGPQEIAVLSDLKEELVKKTLARMAADGEITKVGRGRYSLGK